MPLLNRLPDAPKWVWAPVACPDWIYANRNRVERPWAKLKEWRAVATSYK